MEMHIEALPMQKGAEHRHEQYVQELVAKTIYEDVPAEIVRKESRMLQKDEAVWAHEQETGSLQRVEQLAQGLDAHSQANRVFFGSWQDTLHAQRAPEKLTREDVQQLRLKSRSMPQCEASERTARQAYGAMVADGEEWEIPVWEDRITLHPLDMQLLVNDLSLREAERGLDRQARAEAHNRLDAELAEMIAQVSDEEDRGGKRLELKELYLFRRLIHDADVGHLVTVEHSTPREDLKAHRAIDMRIAVAGEVVPFQVKTFKEGATREARMWQWEREDRAERRLEGTGIFVALLRTEAVERAYDNAERSARTGVRSTLTDKYLALAPLMDAFSPQGRSRLFGLLGITEEQMAEEQRLAEERAVAARAAQAENFLRIEERIRRERELAERVAEERKQQEIREQLRQQQEEEEKQAKSERYRQTLQEESQKTAEQIRAKAVAKMEKHQQAEAHFHASLKAKEEQKKEDARLAAEAAAAAAKAEERRKAREAKEAIGWPPKQFVGMVKAPLLESLGLLDAEKRNDPSQILAAKKKFLQMFAQPKKGAAPLDTDKPNAYFKEVFPTAASLYTPDAEVLDRLRGQKAA